MKPKNDKMPGNTTAGIRSSRCETSYIKKKLLKNNVTSNVNNSLPVEKQISELQPAVEESTIKTTQEQIAKNNIEQNPKISRSNKRPNSDENDKLSIENNLKKRQRGKPPKTYRTRSSSTGSAPSSSVDSLTETNKANAPKEVNGLDSYNQTSVSQTEKKKIVSAKKNKHKNNTVPDTGSNNNQRASYFAPVGGFASRSSILECHKCGDYFENLIHLLNHNCFPKTCDQCEETFDTIDLLNSHLDIVHGRTNKDIEVSDIHIDHSAKVSGIENNETDTHHSKTSLSLKESEKDNFFNNATKRILVKESTKISSADKTLKKITSQKKLLSAEKHCDKDQANSNKMLPKKAIPKKISLPKKLNSTKDVNPKNNPNGKNVHSSINISEKTLKRKNMPKSVSFKPTKQICYRLPKSLKERKVPLGVIP